MPRPLVAGLGGVAAALVGSLCCAGPLLFVTLGVGAGLASTFEPLRPLFGAVMLAFFAFGFHRVYARRRAESVQRAAAARDSGAATGASCTLPRRRDRDELILWTAAGIALVLWTFPTWSQLLL